MMFKAELEFRGSVCFEIEADDRDDAAFKAVTLFEDCDKGRLSLSDMTVTGTYVEAMTRRDIREIKNDVEN